MGEVTVTVTFPVHIKQAKPEVIAESVKRCTMVMMAIPRGKPTFRYAKLTPEDISVSFEPPEAVPAPVIQPPCNIDIDIVSPLPRVAGVAEVVDGDDGPPWEDNNEGTTDATEED
jgi:hypothetical protein